MQKLDINIKEIQEKLVKQLEPSGWGHIFNDILRSNMFHEIIYKLKTEAENDRRFTPPVKELFRAFEECPYDDLKVIMIGQDPYPQLGVADGISFSCSKTMKLQPSLRYIFKDLSPSQYDSMNPDLKRWSNQGVLMLNTAFTVQINKIGTHYAMWKPITHHILQSINREFKDIPTVLLGKKAEEWQIRLDKQKIYKVAHPASAAYKGGVWKSDGVFNKVNEELRAQNKGQITWM